MARSKPFSLLSVLTQQQEDTKIFQAQVPDLSFLAMPSLAISLPSGNLGVLSRLCILIVDIQRKTGGLQAVECLSLLKLYPGVCEPGSANSHTPGSDLSTLSCGR